MKTSLVTVFVIMLAAASGRKLAENLDVQLMGDGPAPPSCGWSRYLINNVYKNYSRLSTTTYDKISLSTAEQRYGDAHG